MPMPILAMASAARWDRQRFTATVIRTSPAERLASFPPPCPAILYPGGGADSSHNVNINLAGAPPGTRMAVNGTGPATVKTTTQFASSVGKGVRSQCLHLQNTLPAKSAGQRRARARPAAGAVGRKAHQARIAAPAASPRASRQPEPRPSRRAERADFSHLAGLIFEGGLTGEEARAVEPVHAAPPAALSRSGYGRSDPAIQSSWTAAFVKAGVAPAAPRRTATLRGPTGRLIPVQIADSRLISSEKTNVEIPDAAHSTRGQAGAQRGWYLLDRRRSDDLVDAEKAATERAVSAEVERAGQSLEVIEVELAIADADGNEAPHRQLTAERSTAYETAAKAREVLATAQRTRRGVANRRVDARG